MEQARKLEDMIGPGSSPAEAAFAERHYTVAEIAAMWRLSPDAVRRLFEREPGVLVLRQNEPRYAKRRYITLRIPASVVERVHRRLSMVRSEQSRLTGQRK